MKILPVEKIREADEYTIQNEPIASIELMERAAKGCVDWIVRHLDNPYSFSIFCGTGNNGGDGLAIARMLKEAEKQVNVFIIRSGNKETNDFAENYFRLKKTGIEITNIETDEDIPVVSAKEIIIDAILGSGLSKPVEGIFANVISALNKSNAFIISIDVPSGLPVDKSAPKSEIVHANITLSFELPKLAFLFPQNYLYVGEWDLIPIQLSQEYIQNVQTQNYLINRLFIQSIHKIRNKYSHKGTFGHALLIAGSTGKYGAAVLGAEACLRSGVGLLTVHSAVKGLNILQTAVPEAMFSQDTHDNYFSTLPDISHYSAIAIGPGIGTAKESQNQLKLLIQNVACPLVLDADALNILAENKTWISFLPKESIFTPHPGEFARLFGKVSDDFERNKIQREMSVKYGIYIVLKGAHTAITTPEGKCYFNSTGNPGMATAGSGDVLTGIILGLLAQNYSPKEAVILGVYLHGLAGDFAVKNKSEESMIARDIIHNLATAFQAIKNSKR